MESQEKPPRKREEQPNDGPVKPDLQISVDEAKGLLQAPGAGEVVLVDIRSEGETCLGHIQGTRFAAPGRISAELEGLRDREDAVVLVYCSSGARSLAVVRELRKKGFSAVRSLAGGYDAWLKKGAGMVTGNRFTIGQLDRYSRNMLLKEVGEEGQTKLMEAKVLLVGAGGLASSAALYLAAAGVGTLGIVDFDTVDLSNLNRQIIHGTDDVGKPKVESAAAAMRRINPEVKVLSLRERLTAGNARRIIDDFDVVMDATDNIETKFLLNDTCYHAGKPYVFGGAVGFEGQAGVFWPKREGGCLRCLFPSPPPRHLAPS
jgi:sulfur-carrier protein adenylyltransferase/sulfurtransferase